MRRTFSLLIAAVAVVAASAQWSNPSQDIPAYHAAPPSKPLPQVLQGMQLTGPYFAHSYQVKAYQMAQKIPAVLYQLPCYCRCDRAMGHNSLHSCFEDTHGAACSTCMKEGVFAYQQTRKGKTPSQIRAAIERGEWMNLDLEKVQ